VTAPVPVALAVAAFRGDPTITGQIAVSQIGTQLHDTYPAIRVTQVGGSPRPLVDTSAPELQWEVWGSGPDSDAEWVVALIAQAVDNVVESGALVKTYPGVGTIRGTWTVSAPFSSPDPTTSRVRYMGTLGMLAQP
jgi:hypothetical protein